MTFFTPRDLLSQKKIFANKELGQNFLTNSSISQNIVNRSHLQKNDMAIEIGAGLGALTIPLAQKVSKVIAIEKDSRLIDLLAMNINANLLTNVDVHNQDILKFDFQALFKNLPGPVVVFGNLPYNISTQILIRLIQNRYGIDRAVLMFQKELAQRLKADPGSKVYGRISVVLQYCAKISSILEIPAKQFFPRPNVDSTVLNIQFQNPVAYEAKNEILFFNVVKSAFGQRRKILSNALAGSDLGMDSKTAVQTLKAAQIEPTRRAETLSVEEFVRLSNFIAENEISSGIVCTQYQAG